MMLPQGEFTASSCHFLRLSSPDRNGSQVLMKSLSSKAPNSTIGGNERKLLQRTSATYEARTQELWGEKGTLNEKRTCLGLGQHLCKGLRSSLLYAMPRLRNAALRAYL